MAASQTNIGVNASRDIHADQINVVQNITPADPPPKNVRFKVEKPIQTFTGREKFLEELHKVVKEGQTGGGGGVTVLTQEPLSVVAATGGIGKTETVRRYIQLHGHEYDHIIWIDAEDNSFAQRQFLQLATELKISTDLKGKQKEFESILKEIFGELLVNAHVVLLVFDNAELLEDDEELNLSGIKSLRPKSLSPFFVEPTIIVTSRNQNWSLQKVIQLDLWTEVEVVVFVTGRLKLENNSENKILALELGTLFGRLPIALQAAVAVILQQTRRKKNYGIQTLINEYDNGCRKVLAQKPLEANMRPAQTSIPMLVLWNISLEKIVRFEDGALAIKILCFMSYMSSVRIPQEFLYSLFQNDWSQDSFENAIVILEDYSLIASLTSDDSDSRSLSIHRMIQDSTIENLKTTNNEEQTPSAIFSGKTFVNEAEVLFKLSCESLNYLETFTTLTFPRRGELAETLVQIANHVSGKLDVQHFRDLTAGVAEVLQDTNNFTKSIELFERALKATPAPSNNIEIVNKIKLQENLASAYREKGHAQKSLDLRFQVLEVKIGVLGPHHEDTLIAKCTVAADLQSLERYDEAIEICKEVLQAYENNGDTQSKNYLLVQSSYADLLFAKGEKKVASELLTQVLKEQKKDPDSNSISIIVTNAQIAGQLEIEGHLEEALQMRLQNIEDATKLLGPIDLTTLRFKQYYASRLFSLGKHDEAVSHLLELLETEETQLGPDHPKTLSTKFDLGHVYLAAKKLDKAEVLLDFEVLERVLGSEHPDTLRAATDLSLVKEGQGKFKDALALLKRVLEVRKKVLGPNHEDALDTVHTIGNLYAKMEEYEKAAPLLQELLETQETQLGSDHRSTLGTKLTLVEVYLATRELDKAEALLNVEVWERVFGPEHPWTLGVATMLSRVKEEQSKFGEALAISHNVLEVRKNVLGPNHEDTLSTMHTIGNLYAEMKEYEKAAPLFRDLLKAEETQLGPRHRSTLKTKLILGVVYFATKELGKAEALFDVELMEKVFGREHPTTLEAATMLSLVKEEQGKFGEALAISQKVLEVRKKVLGQNHEDTLSTMHKISKLFAEMDEYKKAIEVAQELLERREEALGKDHPDAINTLKFLTGCMERLVFQNNLTVNFMVVTSVDAEAGKFILKASNWDLEAALETYRNSNPTALIGDQDHESTSSKTETAAEIKNNLIVKFMAVTEVNAETGKSSLQASDWNLEAALVSFFDISDDEDNSDIDSEDDALIPQYFSPTQSATATDAGNQNGGAASYNETEVIRVQHLEVQVESVFKSNQPTTSILFRLPGGTRLPGEFGASSTVKDLYEFVNNKEQETDPDSNSESHVAAKLNTALKLIYEGHLEEASKMLLQNIEDATKLLGPFDLHTLQFKRYYAAVLNAQKKFDLAARLLMELLETEETQLGSHHRSTLETKRILSVVHIATKELDKAEALLDVGVWEKVFGPEHPETIKAATVLSDVKEEQGKLGDALALRQKVLHINETVLGPNHKDTLSTMYIIGVLYYKVEDYETSAEVAQDLLQRQAEALGKDHRKAIETLELLTWCMERLVTRNNLTMILMAMTSVDAETGKLFLKASNWNFKAAFDTYRNTNPNQSRTLIAAQIKNNLIRIFMTMTGVNAETGKSCLQASDWSLEGSLEAFFDSTSYEDIAEMDLQGDASITSNLNVATASCNETEVNQIQDLEVQVESVAEANPPTTSILFCLAGGAWFRGHFGVSSTVKGLYKFVNEKRPDLADSNYVLTLYPNIQLIKMEETLEEAKIPKNVALALKMLKE